MKLSTRILPLSAILLVLCCGSTEKKFTYTKFIVGGVCEITYYTDNDSIAGVIYDDVDEELVRVDSLLNRYSEKSLVSELNRLRRISAPRDIVYLFELSDSISHLTDGLFDISVAPLVQLWGFYRKELQVPDTAQIEQTKGLVDFKKIIVQDDSIFIQEGMTVDLGGIAQGYAADRVAQILRQYRVTSALINIGGEIAAIGRSPKGRPWRVGIRHPREQGIIETVELEDMALSTSGDYEKYFVINNRRYPHIINPETGFPALDFVSITVFADKAAYADAIATATAIMGPVRGLKFLDSLDIRGIMYFEEDGELKRIESMPQEQP
jgi:thiamine biosynthesis lipoprotein